MQIEESRSANTVSVKIKGRLDLNASWELEKELGELMGKQAVKTVSLDMSGIEYISSAGIRVLLGTHKTKGDKEFIIKSPSKFVQQILEVTGADIILSVMA